MHEKYNRSPLLVLKRHPELQSCSIKMLWLLPPGEGGIFKGEALEALGRARTNKAARLFGISGYTTLKWLKKCIHFVFLMSLTSLSAASKWGVIRYKRKNERNDFNGTL